jgi:hypothetical protein
VKEGVVKKLDWKSLGQFVSLLVSLFALIRDTLAKAGVGIEILPWLLNEGRNVFVAEFLEPLGAKFLATQRIRVVNATTIMVNLDVAPRLPFDGATVESHIGSGWVKVQLRKDGLYVDGRKVILYLSERQKSGGSLKGYELRDELTGKPVLNANLLDALYENTHLVPEDWKRRDEAGNIRFICFLATTYRNPGVVGLCVRYLYFFDGAWSRGCSWLGNGWRGYYLAALLASS